MNCRSWWPCGLQCRSAVARSLGSSSSSTGTTAHCGFWPVEQCPSIFFLSATNSLHLFTPSTWRSLSTSSFQPFLGFPLLLVPSSSWVKIFQGILSSSILSWWPNQLILCPFFHFTIFSPLLISSSSRFVRLFHSPFSYLGPYILLNIFLSKNDRWDRGCELCWLDESWSVYCVLCK